MSSLGASAATEDDNEDLRHTIDEARKVKRWVQEIKIYETKSERWEEKAKKILRRYKDDRSPREQKVPRFNILWSVTESSQPALFGSNPKPDIERRFRDKDNLGRVSSMVLERATTYFINEEFGDATRDAVKDRLLVGRGVVWARYEPHFKDISEDENEETASEGEELTDDVTETNDGSGEEAGASVGQSGNEDSDNDEEAGGLDDRNENSEVSDEIVAWDYVHWQDFGHSFGRTWGEVPAAWRKVYLVRKELRERFGKEIGDKITLDYSPHDLKDNKYDEVEKKATIYEIWDKADKKVCWIHKDYHSSPLDEQDDPLRIDGFWPFPRPLFATLANDDCIPTPDYIEWQDQANELDELTSRIGAITKAVKVAGVYDASAQGIARVLAEGVENQLVPVDQFAILAEKGGLKNVMMLLPMEEILQTLLGLYEARDKVKQDLYEISGSADIMRGQSDPDETAAAQTIKSQFGTMRLQDKQDQVKRFCRDLVKIAAQIIANHFSLDTIKKISGIELLTAEEKQIVETRTKMLQQIQQQNQQQSQVTKQSPQPPSQMQLASLPPLPAWLQKSDAEDMQELLENPTWEEVEELLHDEITLSYKIDIETDSTIKFDQEADKQARVQFLEAVGQFLQAVNSNQNPDLAPLLGKLLEFGARGFKIGKELETAFDIAIHKLEKDASGPPKPNPEMMKIQGEQQIAQDRLKADLQIEAAKGQAEQQRLEMQAKVDAHQGQVDAELEKFKIQLQGQLDAQKAQADREMALAKARMDNETKIIVAQIQAKSQLQNTALTKEGSGMGIDGSGNAVQMPTNAELISTVLKQLQETFSQSTQAMAQSHQHLAQAIMKPKQVMRDEKGNIVGVQ